MPKKQKKKPMKKKPMSAAHRQKISAGVSNYHKKCKYSMGVVTNISQTKQNLIDSMGCGCK